MSGLFVDAIGFIFARGGSKGLPGKNIRPLAGKPLVVWAIEHAQAVERLRRVIVSTDSDDIAAIARSAGAEVPFIRPAQYAQDDSPEWLAWRHALEFVRNEEGSFPDAMVSVPTTAPLRHPIDIENCLDVYAEGDADVVITVTDAHRNPYFNMVEVKPDGTVGLVVSSQKDPTHRQMMPEVFDMTTVAYVCNPEFVFANQSPFAGRVRHLHVPTERAIDIDTSADFELAEYLLAKQNNEISGE